jgi:hypothetical protein
VKRASEDIRSRSRRRRPNRLDSGDSDSVHVAATMVLFLHVFDESLHNLAEYFCDLNDRMIRQKEEDKLKNKILNVEVLYPVLYLR